MIVMASTGRAQAHTRSCRFRTACACSRACGRLSSTCRAVRDERRTARRAISAGCTPSRAWSARIPSINSSSNRNATSRNGMMRECITALYRPSTALGRLIALGHAIASCSRVSTARSTASNRPGRKSASCAPLPREGVGNIVLAVFDTSRHGKVRELRPGQCARSGSAWFYATSDWPVNVIAVPELANL